MASINWTYDNAAMREDLLDILRNVTPTDTQLLSGLGTSSASQIRHETVVKTLNAVKDNAQIEGADATYIGLTNPSRQANYTQIFKQGYKVSNTERAVNSAGFNDRFALEAADGMRMLKADMEYAFMRGSLVSGNGSAARKLQGIKNSLSLITSMSGVSLSEVLLNDLFQWTWTNGVEVNAVYAPMYIKRKIAAFTGAATNKNISVEDKRLVNSVDVYQADAAKMVKLFAHRYVTVAADTNYDIVGINEDYFKVAYLRKPAAEIIPPIGDSTQGQITAEATLQSEHYFAGFYSTKNL